MKKLIFTFILISFYFAVNSQESETKAKQYVYFFLDCGCFCQPEKGMGYDRHHVITDTVYIAVIDSLEIITGQFKEYLKDNYSNYSQLLPNLIIRYYETQEQAQTARNNKIAKMRSRDYKVIEENFSPQRKDEKIVQKE